VARKNDLLFRVVEGTVSNSIPHSRNDKPDDSLTTPPVVTDLKEEEGWMLFTCVLGLMPWPHELLQRLG
jgi:hypothetical protein